MQNCTSMFFTSLQISINKRRVSKHDLSLNAVGVRVDIYIMIKTERSQYNETKRSGEKSEHTPIEFVGPFSRKDFRNFLYILVTSSRESLRDSLQRQYCEIRETEKK